MLMFRMPLMMVLLLFHLQEIVIGIVMFLMEMITIILITLHPDGIIQEDQHQVSADNVICVGSIGSKVAEYKSNFSNWGARVDVWAPGSDIISAVYDKSSADDAGYGSVVADSRSASYHIASINGTSMASPQVCGVNCLSCRTRTLD